MMKKMAKTKNKMLTKEEKLEALIAYTQKCYDELNSVWDSYFSLCPEEEEYCTHMDNLLYDFYDMIERMTEKKQKIKVVEALLKEESLYDKVDNVLYYPDTSSHPYRFHGIQEFHIAVPAEEILKEYDSITEFCLGCIPAPAANSENENGYARFIEFYVPEEDRDETENEIREELSWYVARLEEDGILSQLVVN